MVRGYRGDAVKRLRNSSKIPGETMTAVVEWIAQQLGINLRDGSRAEQTRSQIPLRLEHPCERCSPKLAENTQCRFLHYVEHSDKRHPPILHVKVPLPTFEMLHSCSDPNICRNVNPRQCHETPLENLPRNRSKGKLPSLAN